MGLSLRACRTPLQVVVLALAGLSIASLAHAGEPPLSPVWMERARNVVGAQQRVRERMSRRWLSFRATREQMRAAMEEDKELRQVFLVTLERACGEVEMAPYDCHGDRYLGAALTEYLDAQEAAKAARFAAALAASHATTGNEVTRPVATHGALDGTCVPSVRAGILR